jgi:ABC-type multidrug transport system permease subunit
MNFFEALTNNPIGLIVKLFMMVSSILYLIYAAVVYRQTQMMVKTVKLEHNWTVILVSFIQVIVALVLILIAFAIV